MEIKQSDALKRLPEQFFSKWNGRIKQLEASGYDVINLGQGSPDLPTDERITDALRHAALDPVNHQYPPYRGFAYFKKGIVHFYRRKFNIELNDETEVAILFGSRIGIFHVVKALLNPGDYALLPDPGYPDYLSSIRLADARFDVMPLAQENRFLPDYDNIPIEQAKRAKLMFINYPNNPTGAVASLPFFEKTVDFAKRNDIFVVHDFAYEAICYDGKKHPSFLEAEGAKEIGIELYSMSKTFNMAGWRVGFAVGNEAVIEMINKLQDHLFISLFGGIQYAATEALLGSQPFVDRLVKTYEQRRNTFINHLQKIGWNVDPPQGTFFAWLKVPDGYSSEQFTNMLLEKAHVAVASGDWFGEHGKGYIRVGLLAPEERLVEAVHRIAKLNLFNK